MTHGESPPTGAELAALFDAALADLQDSIERRRRSLAPNGSVRSDADWGMIEEAFTLVCRAAFTLREVADITRAARLKVLETSSMSAVKPRVIRGLAAEAFMKASDLADALGDFDAAVSFADLAMTTVESLADFGRDRAEAEFLGSAAGNAGWSRLRRNGPDDVASARKILNDAAQWYRRADRPDKQRRITENLAMATALERGELDSVERKGFVSRLPAEPFGVVPEGGHQSFFVNIRGRREVAERSADGAWITINGTRFRVQPE